MFELRERDGLGRIGRLEVHGKVVTTPALLPVVNPYRPVVPPREIARRFRAEALMTNAYIVARGDLRSRAESEGIHRVLGFDGLVMTDSGAFQTTVYGDVSVSNEEIVSFQRSIRTDLGTVLDVISGPDADHDRAAADLEETARRTSEAASMRGDMALVGPVQGGLHPELRQRSADLASKADVEVCAIGGVVPLMESYRFVDLVRVIVASKLGLTTARPVHLFGAGHPIVFPLAALLGCDLFDSASYAKFARDGRLLFPDGTRHVEDLATLPCECPVCTESTAEEMRADETKRALHNLYVSFGEVARVRQAVHDGSLWELVERRARAHPALLSSLRELRNHAAFLEEFEPVSRHGAVRYTGPETVFRPILARYRHRLEQRFVPPARNALVMLPEGPRPYTRHYRAVADRVGAACDAHLVVKSAFGPVPLELDEMYPLSQSLLPDTLDLEVLEASEVFFRQFARAMGYGFGAFWTGDATLEEVRAHAGPPREEDRTRLRVNAVADMQFGRGAGRALLEDPVRFVVSKSTGRVRNVFSREAHVASVRAHDGMLTLKAAGAERLHAAFPSPALRVVVATDTAEFNRAGKNVFAKFVVDADPGIRPGDEVLVVDESDRLVAVGRAFLNRREMLDFGRGVAASVREGLPPPAG